MAFKFDCMEGSTLLDIILSTCGIYLVAGRVLVMDRFYTTMKVARGLLELGVGMVGTIMVQRFPATQLKHLWKTGKKGDKDRESNKKAP